MKALANSLLALGPHPDDVELGLGATLSKFQALGVSIQVLVLSSAEESLPQGFSARDIQEECLESMGILGVQRENVHFKGFPVRRFSEHRQDILELLVEYDRQLAPELVFCPSLSDTHQDHAVVAQEAVRAFRRRTVLGYELPWNNQGFDPMLSIQISDKEIERKEQALLSYRSQHNRTYFEPGLLRNLARLRASVSGADFAETFEVIRMVLQ